MPPRCGWAMVSLPPQDRTSVPQGAQSSARVGGPADRWVTRLIGCRALSPSISAPRPCTGCPCLDSEGASMQAYTQAFCGIDWAEDHHDIAIIDTTGTLLARARIGNDPAGLRRLLQLLADAGDNPEQPIPVAIETARGLLVACLRATGRPVYAINPVAVARYRERHTVARSKSDQRDALVLAHILRTDAAAHRPLPADSERAQAITVLARGQQDAVWACQQLANQLRTVLLAFFPAAVAVFCVKHVGLTSREARTVLAAAPTPTRAATLTRAQLRA